jgi:hypothetical protein
MASHHPHKKVPTWADAVKASEAQTIPRTTPSVARARKIKKPQSFVFCARCGCNFKPDAAGARYCSEEHRLDDERDAKAKGKAVCAYCAHTFDRGAASNRKYCDAECIKAAKSERMRARRATAEPVDGWMTREQIAAHFSTSMRQVSRWVRTGRIEKRKMVRDCRQITQYRPAIETTEDPPPMDETKASYAVTDEIEISTDGFTRHLVCKMCGAAFTQTGTGRSRHYCNEVCCAQNRADRLASRMRAARMNPPRRTARSFAQSGPENLVTADRIAAYLAMEEGQVLELVDAGVIPCLNIGSAVRFRLSAVRAAVGDSP